MAIKILGNTVIDNNENLTIVGDATIEGDVTVGNNGTTIWADGGITVGGNAYFNGSAIFGDNKAMLTYSDNWLKLNQHGDFTNGTYSSNNFYINSTLTVTDLVTMNNHNGYQDIEPLHYMGVSNSEWGDWVDISGYNMMQIDIWGAGGAGIAGHFNCSRTTPNTSQWFCIGHSQETEVAVAGQLMPTNTEVQLTARPADYLSEIKFDGNGNQFMTYEANSGVPITKTIVMAWRN